MSFTLQLAALGEDYDETEDVMRATAFLSYPF